MFLNHFRSFLHNTPAWMSWTPCLTVSPTLYWPCLAVGSPLGSGPGSPARSLSLRRSMSVTGELPNPWAMLVEILVEGLALLRRHHVPRILIKCLFKQLFGFINIQLFNQLLLRPECCSSINAK